MMILDMLGFLHLSLVDILDIVMVGAMIFLVFRWIRGSSAMNIFVAIIILYLIKILASALNMTMVSGIMGTVLDVGVIALIVIFQPEIRHFLTKLGGRSSLTGRSIRFLDKLFGRKILTIGELSARELIDAVREMSSTKTGALIVLTRTDSLSQFIETGDEIDALISKRLLLNIFFKNSPLHDGALIITGNRITAARCTLPITDRADIPANYGMRHKAAIGVSEECDAIVIVVSEETGTISIVKDGFISPISDPEEIRRYLHIEDHE